MNPDAPETQKLAAQIRRDGVTNALHITRDGDIISGHRRYEAAKLAGLKEVPAKRLNITWAEDPAECMRRLVAENSASRVKTFKETMREELFEAAEAGKGYEALVARQEGEAKREEGEAITLKKYKPRSIIGSRRTEFLAAVRKILDEKKRFLPLTGRQIHYLLLNDPPLRDASKKKPLRYGNNPGSSKALSKLLTDARVSAQIPMTSIADPTRPLCIWKSWQSPGPFIGKECDGFLLGYFRNLQMTQPVHLEVVAEKMTVQKLLEPVVWPFRIPLTVGRGYCSMEPRAKMLNRFRASGKPRMIVLLISDADPDGESIAETFVRSMRDDFDLGDDVTGIKIALTVAEAKARGFPGIPLKSKSKQAPEYRRRHGDLAWELEALEPEELQEKVRDAIRGQLDIEAFNRELEQERRDRAELQVLRRRFLSFAADLDDGEEDE